MLHQRLADALGQAAVNLARDDRRIDEAAGVVDRGEVAQLHPTGLGIDQHDAQLSAGRIVEVARVVEHGFVETELEAVGIVAAVVRRLGDLGERDATIGACYGEGAVW